MPSHRHHVRVPAVIALCALMAGCATIEDYEGAWRTREVRGESRPRYERPRPSRPRMGRPEVRIAGTTGLSASDLALLPPEAKPGECYARVYIPPRYETMMEKLLVEEASEEAEIIPAEYAWAEEEVLVEEASEKIEVVPAVYEWVDEKVLVKSATTRLEEVPARYETVEQRVLIKPAHTLWKTGRGPIEKMDNATGEIMCLVKVPPVYDTVKKRVLVHPAATKKVVVPAEYETVRKKIVVKPPTTRKVAIPAKYETVKVRKLAKAEERKVTTIPARHETVTKQVLVAEGRIEWRKVVCETNMSRDIVSRIQQALLDAGYDPGPVDGAIGPQTKTALEGYQVKNGLAVGGITYQTLEHLKVEVPKDAVQTGIEGEPTPSE